MGERREFFSSFMKYAASINDEFKRGYEESKFYSSTKYCYALISELTEEELFDAARQKGIDPEGKTKLALAKAVFGSRVSDD